MKIFATLYTIKHQTFYQKGNTAMLKHAWFNYEFDWLLKVDSDTYVNLIRLQVLLRMLSQSSNAFLGNRGTDMKEDTKALHPAVQFCLGGPGFLISRMTLERTVNHLDGCVLENKDNAKLWFDDVIISQCIQNYTSLGCHEGDNLDNVTYTEMNFYEHHDNRSPQYTTVTYHPLNDSKSMGEYHEEVMKPRPGYTQF